MNDDLDKDRELLRGIATAARSGNDVYDLYAQVKTSNAIVRLLDSMGLDGHWFTFGPYHGWYINPGGPHWTVIDLEDKLVTPKGSRFVEAIDLIVAGDADGVRQLWHEVAGR